MSAWYVAPAKRADSMRLFFHLTNGTDLILDEDGLEVEHLDEVRNAIADDIEELKREFPAQDWSSWRLEVTDQIGAVVLSVALNGFD
jgi:hypothetical protein